MSEMGDLSYNPFEGIDFDKRRWDKLLEEIDNGNVIPIIGPDMLVDLENEGGRRINLHQQIITYIAKYAGLTGQPSTFSQLVYNKRYLEKVSNRKDLIYPQIDAIINHVYKDVAASQILTDLLGTKKFKFVITTSFTPIVENLMKQIWGDKEVRVIYFNNDPKHSKIKGDISHPNDLDKPTVFYMFGKYCANEGKFAVTDTDMMKFCSSWIKKQGIPINIVNAIKNKYLLMFGNDQSDWLFRFVWFSLREETEKMKTDVVVKEAPEDSLKEFLARLQTFFQDNPSAFVNKIVNEINNRTEKVREETNKRTMGETNYQYDVFISYSRSDKKIAEFLHQALCDQNYLVYLDNKTMKGGDDWKSHIREAIDKSRLFVPILSKNIEREFLVPHEYRAEWNFANDIAKNMGIRPFIIPFAERQFNFSNRRLALPEGLLDKNAVFYNDDEDMTDILTVIDAKLKELDSLMNENQHR